MAWTIFTESVLSDSNLHGFWAERCEATQHLANQDSVTPDICFVIIASPDDHLWRSISWSTTIRSDSFTLKIGEPL